MAEEGKGAALAILGVVAVIAVVGLVLLFKGGTGKVTYGPGPFIEPSAKKACSIIMCQNGMGAVVVGEKEDFWVCRCPQQFQEQRIVDWSNAWRGDEARDGGLPSYGESWLVRKIREY
jgi:hypothetical protein